MSTDAYAYGSLTGCGKGLCPRMATRWATYTCDGVPCGLMRSCDQYDMEPSEPLEQAEAARKWNADNAEWLDEYDPPKGETLVREASRADREGSAGTMTIKNNTVSGNCTVQIGDRIIEPAPPRIIDVPICDILDGDTVTVRATWRRHAPLCRQVRRRSHRGVARSEQLPSGSECRATWGLETDMTDDGKLIATGQATMGDATMTVHEDADGRCVLTLTDADANWTEANLGRVYRVYRKRDGTIGEQICDSFDDPLPDDAEPDDGSRFVITSVVPGTNVTYRNGGGE